MFAGELLHSTYRNNDWNKPYLLKNYHIVRQSFAAQNFLNGDNPFD